MRWMGNPRFSQQGSLSRIRSWFIKRLRSESCAPASTSATVSTPDFTLSWSNPFIGKACQTVTLLSKCASSSFLTPFSSGNPVPLYHSWSALFVISSTWSSMCESDAMSQEFRYSTGMPFCSYFERFLPTTRSNFSLCSSSECRSSSRSPSGASQVASSEPPVDFAVGTPRSRQSFSNSARGINSQTRTFFNASNASSRPARASRSSSGKPAFLHVLRKSSSLRDRNASSCATAEMAASTPRRFALKPLASQALSQALTNNLSTN
mmetsp:Transcript_61359/g.171723  ORF Transcript_61359/g.171723 Transcript_61359/m.171723 type:complete len:265 (+) Transcript_61359:329-1123(+)